MSLDRAFYLTSEALVARFTFTRFALLLLAVIAGVGAWENPLP
jgi:hypothetical protein